MASNQLPEIIAYDHVSDAGEYGNDICAHCGAKGRYQHHFLTTAGPRAAMAGCVQLFPISRIAKTHGQLLTKQREYGQKGWKLPSWDQDKLEAIQALQLGLATRDEVELRIANAEFRAAEFRRKKFGRR